jgi:cell division protein FtsN
VFVGEDERGRTWYVVRVGNYTEREEAFAAAKRFRQEVGVPAVVAYFDSLEAVAPDVEEVEQQTAETLYSVQVGSHLSAENANATMKDYAAKGYEACVMTIFDDRGKAWHVVQIGDFPSREEAETLGKRFKQQEGRPFSIKALDAALLKERKQCP